MFWTRSKPFIIIITLWLSYAVGVLNISAQSRINEISFPSAPISQEEIQSELSNFQSNTSLTAEGVESIEATYNSALNALDLAEQARQDALRFERELQEAETTERRLREQIAELEQQIISGETADDLDRSLTILERDLANLEGELRAYRTELSQHDATLDMLLLRPALIRETLTQAREDEAALTQQLSEQEELSEDPRELSARRLMQSQFYRRTIQLIALESELASIGPRQELVSLRRDLAALKIAKTEARVLQLQSKTGQRRIRLAQQVLDQAKSDLSLAEKEHSFVRDYAAANYARAAILSDISQNGGLYPHRLAKTQGALALAREDLRLANQLIELGNLNRASNTNLRRIQSKREPISAIKVEISETKKDIADQMQARILAEDELRDLTIRGASLHEEFETWKIDNIFASHISDSDLELLSALNVRRRDYLAQLTDTATSNINDANILLEVQTEWRGQVTNLRDLLNKTLLWIPSSQIIGQAWPGQVLRGVAKLIHIDRIGSVTRSFTSGFWRFFPLFMLALLMAAASILSRRKLYEALGHIADKVGHVQNDSYWHTPRAIAICGLIVLPLPVIFGFIGFVLLNSVTPDPFVAQLGQAGVDLAGFLWFFLTWAEWNRDQAVMGPHFTVEHPPRQVFLDELKWFTPLAAILIGVVTATQNSRDIDVYSGVSILAFILTAITITVFAFRVLWLKRDILERHTKDGRKPIWRYRRPIMLIFIGLPIVSAVLGVLGFYETARVLLSRLLFSSGLLVSTFVLYGLIRRTVVVARRRLSLKQAIERRDRVVKERKAEAAALQRGETLPPAPTIDYQEIDVETISRQTSQLLNMLVTVGFAVLMWLFWQDLLPALSVIDTVKIPLGQSVGAGGEVVNLSLSLWTIMKSIAILALTVIAGRNLPGFLEVFVLESFKLEPGTRYAITTVLGYIIFAIGLAIAFTVLGLEWAKLQWIVAALGVGIGFGLQEIIANFISGLIILFERPIRIGDYVTIGDQSGTVSRIKIRATTLTDLDNREILIPNKEIITGRVINWTLSNAVTRLTVKVGIAYGSDTDEASNVIMSIVKNNRKILERPGPQVLFTGFGDSSLDFEVRAFIANFDDRFPVIDGLHSEINKALKEHGISIPFPQRDLHVISQSKPSVTAKSKTNKPKPNKPKPKKPKV